MERERVWRAHINGETVVVRNYAVLSPNEDLVDKPRTETMSLAEWTRRHGEFGCQPDGMPVTPRPGVGVRPPQEPQPLWLEGGQR